MAASRQAPRPTEEGRYVDALYRSLAQAVEDAIAVLDALDGDPDLELEPDQPRQIERPGCRVA